MLHQLVCDTIHISSFTLHNSFLVMEYHYPPKLSNSRKRTSSIIHLIYYLELEVHLQTFSGSYRLGSQIEKCI